MRGPTPDQRPARHLPVAHVAVGSAVLVATACGADSVEDGRMGAGPPSAHPAPHQRVLDLDFERSYTAPGAVVATTENAASTSIRASVTTSAGGRITRADGFDSSAALRFPSYAPEGATPSAALLLWVKDAPDLLSPGDRPFSFSVDFSIDPTSAGTVTDNGDNLLQRGLSEDATQYKLQVDQGVPSCRVAGSGGEAVLKADQAVRAGSWYRVSCSRRDDLVVLVVTPLDPSAKKAEERVEATAVTGSVGFAPSIPMSVGGKVAENGEITTTATDQFNGFVDNVRFEFLG